MNLYRVTCATSVAGGERTVDVYVLAADESEASNLALKGMREANYSFTDYVKHVELLASSNRHKAPMWLIGAAAAPSPK